MRACIFHENRWERAVARELCISILPFRSNLDRRNHRNYWIIYRPDAARREIFFSNCGARAPSNTVGTRRNSNLSNRYLIFTGVRSPVWIIAFYETLIFSGWQDFIDAIKDAFDLRTFVNRDNFSGETESLENSGIFSILKFTMKDRNYYRFQE